MLAYSNDVLKRTLSQRFNVVDRAGPGVLRLRVGFSGVAAQGEGLKPYQYVPIAFVATMATRAAKGGETATGVHRSSKRRERTASPASCWGSESEWPPASACPQVRRSSPWTR